MLLVVPADPEFDENARLLDTERAEFEVAFGAPVRVVRADPGHGPRWVFRAATDYRGPAVLRAAGDLIESVACRWDEVWPTLSWLHTWLRLGRPAELTLSATTVVAEAVHRIEAEIGFSYPSFALRGLDWAELCARHVPAVLDAVDPVLAMQRWMAELADAHTGLRPTTPHPPLPYVGRVDGEEVTLLRVPESSAGYAAGARPGWRVRRPATAGLLARTAAAPHLRPYLAARRLLSAPAGSTVELCASGPDGARAGWREQPAWIGPDGVASWRRLTRDTGYLVVRTWLGGYGLPEKLDAALTELAGCTTLVFDLRGNVGGNYLLGLATRDRFVPPGTAMGTTRFSVGDGALSPPVPICSGETDRVCWAGRLVVLTDPLTYSASEDFLLGLQGLDHVLVVGERSGGGSGRPRTVPLLPDWNLLISTVLTYDRDGRCIEGHGIPVDHPVPAEQALDAALALSG